MSALLMWSIESHSSSTSVNINKIQPGETVTLHWNGLPVIVYKRSKEEIDRIKKSARIHKRPMSNDYTARYVAKNYGSKFASIAMWETTKLENNPLRSKLSDVSVIFGISTMYQCMINYNKAEKTFFDPCSNAQYDLTGLITKLSHREHLDLLIPPHHYEGNTLHIDQNPDIELTDYAPDFEKLDLPLGEKISEAILWNKEKIALSLISSGPHEVYKTDTNATSLHFAANKDSVKVIEALINVGYEINSLTNDGISPLHIAALGRKIENAKLLISKGAKTEAFCQNNICSESIIDFLNHYYPEEASEIRDLIIQRK